MEFYFLLPEGILLSLLLLTSPFLGKWMAYFFEAKEFRFGFLKPFRFLETKTYQLLGVQESHEMTWKDYSLSLLWFHLFGVLILFLFQTFQHLLPLNPQKRPAVSWDSAINTAISFVTNTNWQGYAGETTMSYLTQMGALTVQNFLSAGTGIAVAIAITRGMARKSSSFLGNYWVDLTRSILYLLLPLSFFSALILISQGVIQTLSGPITVTTLEGASQTIPLGPVASQVAIKILGSNGGGFFNTNSSHPFENPTALSNWLQLFLMLWIPASLTYTYGILTGAKKHGWILLMVMLSLFVSMTALSELSESLSPSLEGKELRFGIQNSLLFASATTATSCGAVNAMHSSFSPLSGGIALLNMMLGEVLFGGVGSGLYGMLIFVFLTVFIAGLMVGRSPEYLGKKISVQDITWILVALLVPSACILIGTGVSLLIPTALSQISHRGPHGLTELLYAFTSAAANNGSAFAGIDSNTPYYNLTLGFAMAAGRFGVLFPLLAVAGHWVEKKVSPPSSGTFETDTFLFAMLLSIMILILGGLTFLPVLSLGPLVEHFLFLQHQGF